MLSRIEYLRSNCQIRGCFRPIIFVSHLPEFLVEVLNRPFSRIEIHGQWRNVAYIAVVDKCLKVYGASIKKIGDQILSSRPRNIHSLVYHWKKIAGFQQHFYSQAIQIQLIH